MPKVNPEILTWARETAGLSPEEAAHAIALNDAYGKTGAERLLALEEGDGEPNRPLLLRMAAKYRRPLLTFYLAQQPRQGDRGQDFRTAPGAEPPEYDPTLDTLLRTVNAQQSLVKSLLEDEETEPLRFIGSATTAQGAQSLATAITHTTGFQIQEFRDQETVEEAFSYLRAKIEAVGIFVLLAGNLGSHHTNISTEIFRGFAIADPIAPFVVVNDQDARTAWSFTILHEVAHLWLGQTGVSGASMDAQIEQFCNDVAGEILLPAGEIRELANIRGVSLEDAVGQVTDFAGLRNVSRAMVAYNLLRAGIITERMWRDLRDRLYQDWLEGRARRRETQRARDGGPSYYVVRRHRLGPALLNLVSRSLGEGLLTPTKAGQVLGVKPRNVQPLLSELPSRGGL